MQKPSARQLRICSIALSAATVAWAASFVGIAQSGAPAQNGAAAPAQAPAPNAAEGQGRQGGANADDPANATADYSPKPPVRPLSVAEEQKRFLLPPGYRLEPVLTDPDIEEPAQVAFDGNGRMFVLEIRGYMQDADSGGELDPVGRISVHEDTNNDGKYEKHSVFVDKLVFPRFVLPIGANAVLTMESNADEVWKFTDTNNDGVADKKELFATNFGRSGNVEHQQSHLTWGMDNWMYSTYNAFRIRWTPGGVQREPTGSNGAQWGVTQDNFGKMYFQGGASGMPGYFQFPIHYGNFEVADRFEPNLNTIWGAPMAIADMQGGLPIVRMPQGSLARSTAGAGGAIFRGDRLPADLSGDYLYGEVVGRVVRRLRPVVTQGLPQLRNVYPESEFIRSTDPLFRPVDQTIAPDGTLYIVDMYRGIIQEGQWTKPGTYLRKKIEQYQLDKVVRHGRIWRLTYDGMARDRTRPTMLNETSAQLVTRLSHPNGWWRDTAQQLLVLKQDASVLPALTQLVRRSQNSYARFHALWTIEGLGALTTPLVRELMEDPNPQMRIQAIRASETLYKSGQKSLADDYRQLSKDPDADVVIQALLTLNHFKVSDYKAIVTAAQAANTARGIQEIGRQILTPANTLTGGGRGSAFSPVEMTTLSRGEGIYKELCFSCHGDDGRGTPEPGVGDKEKNLMAPPLAGSSRVQGHRDYVIKTLLHGMTGPLDGKTYAAGVMVPMGTNTDEWIAAIASYVRNSFGNTGTLVTAADVARVRAETASRKESWTVDALVGTLPYAMAALPTWKATASHNAAAAPGGLNYSGWTSGVPQQPGMWFRVELPEPATITEVEFIAPAPPAAGGGRRGRGRGAAPAGGTAVPADAGTPLAGAAPADSTAPVSGAPASVAPASGAPTQPAPVAPTAGFPREYLVEVSLDGTTWKPAATGTGTGRTTTATFAPVQARFVRVTQTASTPNAPAWSIQRFRLYKASAVDGTR
jgi:mono/diheme cytochrome c family protein